MTEPWVGEGQDPWLPERLAYLEEAAEAEMAVREAVWSELAGWLVKVRRSVLAPIRPDPVAVFAHEPGWVKSVDKIVSTAIKDTIGLAYEKVLGKNFKYDQRTMVITHLAEVKNRMINTPDQVFTLVTSEIAKGSELGESIPQLSERIDTVLDDTQTERWPNRATVIARTETLGALNAGRTDSFAAVMEETGEEFEQMWLSTIDKRTRKTHKTADKQRVPIGKPFTVGSVQLRYPGDPLGPGHETIQCRCTTILLEPGENVDMSNRQFKTKQE